MEINDLIKVKVTRVEEGFVLVEYHGQEATLLQTEITWNAGLVNPKDFVKEDEEITVRVIAVNEEKFSPSLKQVNKNPWNNPPKIGSEYNSPITVVAEYGYFVKIEFYCNAILLLENSKHHHSLSDVVNVRVIEVDISQNNVMVTEI